jgi:hypothetical protein
LRQHERQPNTTLNATIRVIETLRNIHQITKDMAHG